MFSLSGAVEIFRRYLLIRTDILQKTVDGCPCYTTPTVRGVSTFAVFFSVPRPFCRFTLVYDGHFVLCCNSEKIEPLDRVMANFNR